MLMACLYRQLPTVHTSVKLTVGAVNLNDVASITGLSRAELYSLNPGHRGESD